MHTKGVFQLAPTGACLPYSLHSHDRPHHLLVLLAALNVVALQHAGGKGHLACRATPSGGRGDRPFVGGIHHDRGSRLRHQRRPVQVLVGKVLLPLQLPLHALRHLRLRQLPVRVRRELRVVHVQRAEDRVQELDLRVVVVDAQVMVPVVPESHTAHKGGRIESDNGPISPAPSSPCQSPSPSVTRKSVAYLPSMMVPGM